MNESTRVALCQICNQTEEWHKLHGVKHAFSPDSTKFRLAEHKITAEAVVNKLPSDPVLRMVLIRKGIISVDDLAEVEKELRTVGIASYEATPNVVGQPRSTGANSEGGTEPVSSRSMRGSSTRRTTTSRSVREPK